MRIDYRRVDNPKDKWRQRMVTLFSFAVAIVLFAIMRAGWLGAMLQGFATLYLVLMACIFAVRAVLTEVGIRRRA